MTKAAAKHCGTMPWLTEDSPLKYPQTLNHDESLNSSVASSRQKHPGKNGISTPVIKAKEAGFVVDAIPTSVNAGRRSVIPAYDASKDKNASHYFRSPNVRTLMEHRTELKYVPPNPKQTPHNKLSFRHRCKSTPTAEELRQRERRFVNDAIKEENSKSRFHTVIPPYHADDDRHCKGYFSQKGLRELLNITLSPR